LSGTRSSFHCRLGVRMFQARKEDSFRLPITGGHGPSRGLDAPCALKFKIAESVTQMGYSVTLTPITPQPVPGRYSVIFDRAVN
jgi:hypothetical protein